MTDNNNTKDDRNKLSAVWNAEPNGIGLDDKITIIENWSYEALKYLPPWIMPEAIESDGYYFVAHSRMDFKIVYTDILRLESVGVDIWYDRAMEPGRNWQEIAERMMNRQECKGVIVYGTVNSMASKPVQIELLVADRLGKNIIFINHGEDLKTTAAKDLYEKAKKTPGVDGAHEETSEEDRERVKAFENLLARIGNANITYIDIAVSSKTKRDKLNLIKSEDVLCCECSILDNAIIIGVKYLGVKSVKIPEQVTIGEKEHNVTAIEACAFANCRALERVEFPEMLEYIGEHAFFGCESLTEVHLGRNVRYVAKNAFENCEKLEEVTVADDNKSIIVKDQVCYSSDYFEGDGFAIFFVPRDLKGAITLLDGLKTIKPFAFAGYNGITSVTIPDSVTSIGGGAFRDCASLTSVTIPDSVTSIGERAFRGCDSLTSVTIGNGVTSIGRGAFSGCTTLAFVAIPDSVTSIGDYAFLGCRSLEAVHITDIGKWAAIDFGSSTANPLNNVAELYLNGELVTDLVIPDGVTSIGDYAFEDCTSLTSVTIPNSVTSIGENVFAFCFSLRHITYLGTVEQWCELTAKCPGWAGYCPCEVVKCKDGEAPVTAEDRGE